ncbi:hypothetical protein [Pseudothauera rhizosphaerae]|uniref:Uncharacterized protein n=1 Tax=Pseudothauera rhizosphaerae TaxID=2565932 RepID=A0A4S4AID4_9RHOO|nr:hypothetical protein [Pseudothauera rhizosphaerae]THF58049.1 hypothetical protein E6O51_17050 [Pseudothauera rhizosphaerae]
MTDDEIQAVEFAPTLQSGNYVPMFWVRLCSDGGYEGPIHNDRIEDVRKHSGAWTPLYLGAATPVPAVAPHLGGPMIDRELLDLERLALDATPGPWIACGPHYGAPHPQYFDAVVLDEAKDGGQGIALAPDGMGESGSPDMAFIAAANPVVVLDLIRRLRAAEAAAGRAKKFADERDKARLENTKLKAALEEIRHSTYLRHATAVAAIALGHEA